VKAPICYSVNQIEVLQTLGNSREAAKRNQREQTREREQSPDDSITMVKTIPAEQPIPSEDATPMAKAKANQNTERAKKPATLATLIPGLIPVLSLILLTCL